MKFKAGSRRKASEYEKDRVSQWKQNKTFEKSVEQRSVDNSYVFYDGPPTANGMPGIHHLIPQSFKDAITRYKTMRGYHVRRKGGWDTHVGQFDAGQTPNIYTLTNELDRAVGNLVDDLKAWVNALPNATPAKLAA